MNWKEWLFVLFLMAFSLFLVSYIPIVVVPRMEIARMATHEGLATPTPQRTAAFAPTSAATPTPTPTLTATASPLPSLTPTATASPTIMASPTITPTRFPFYTHPALDRYIYVDQWTQHMYVFERGELVRDIPCSTGLPDPDKYTPAWTGAVGQYWGTFFAFDVYADEAWYLYKSDGSILIHSLPYVYENGAKAYLDRDALGVRPASHGCVRISPHDALWFTAWGPEGAHITVSDPYREKWQ